MVKGNGAVTYYVNDLYPEYGFGETATDVIPDASDQMALVDSEKTATEVQVNSGTSSKSIFSAILLIAIVGIILGAVN